MLNILIVRCNANKLQKNSGGEERFTTLVEALTDHNLTVFSLSWSMESFEGILQNNIKYISPSIPSIAVRKYKTLMSKNPPPTHDIMFLLNKPYLKEIQQQITDLANNSDIVILDAHHPSVLLDDVKVPIIYNSHNAELFCAKQVYGISGFIEKNIKKVEETAVKKSSAVTYCSETDFNILQELYGNIKKSMYVPNGSTKKEQIDYKKRINSKDIIFVGSNYVPNIEAAQSIIKIAKLVPEKNFIIIGGCGYKIDKKTISDNVKITGFIDEEELDLYFSNSFAFINPIGSGSGTHLKLMKALAYGLPIISSSTGSRGFSKDEINDSMILSESVDEFISAIKFLEIEENFKEKSENSYKSFNNYDWEVIKKQYKAFVEDVVKNKH